MGPASHLVTGDLRAFIDEASISIAMFDREMRYLAASQRWIDHVCHGERDVIGRLHYEVNPEVPQHWRDAHRRGLAGEKSGADREAVQGRESKVWVRWEVCPWRDRDGSIGGITVIGETVTRIVEAEQALQQKLATETKAMTNFYGAALRLGGSSDLREGLEQSLEAAIDLLGADMGNVQLLDDSGTVLRMVAQRGFKEDFLEFFAAVSAAHETACGRALRAGRPVVIEDVELDESFEEFRAVRSAAGYRAVVAAPLMNNRGGKALGMLSVHFRRPHRPSISELQWLDLHRRRTADFIARIRSAQALRESEERLRLAVTASRMGPFDWDIRTGAFLWSDEWFRMLGYEVNEVEPSRAAWMDRIHPDDREKAFAAHERTERQPQHFSSEYRIVRPDGEIRWIRTHGRYLYDDGKAVRLIGLKQDITEARQQIETQRVLVAELQHRTRNLMAVVQSIAHQTLDSVKSLAAFEDQFNRRLEALSRVQSLLSRADNQPITLGALIAMELEPLGAETVGARVTLGGPEVTLRKSVVEMLSLAIHELLTNAIKHGALSAAAGRLSVAWRFDGTPPSQSLVLDWNEHGAERLPSAAPIRSGYGRTLIEEALPYSLSAETKFEIGPDGLRCRISLPLVTSDADEAFA